MPFYDSIATYDSGLLYDDTSSPQPNTRKMAKVKLGLQKLTPDELIDLANTITTAMTGNANFTTPNPTLTAIGTLITTAQAKIDALRNGLSQEADYVQNVSGGDATKIESAGMSVRDTGGPIGTPTEVLNLVVTAGDNEGTLDASWDPVRGAASYEIQTSVDPVSGTSWAFKQSATKSNANIAGLTSGTKMWARVRAVGSGNATGPWSDPATKVVP